VLAKLRKYDVFFVNRVMSEHMFIYYVIGILLGYGIPKLLILGTA